MLSTQNLCGKAILMCLIPILVVVKYDDIICSKTPFKDLATINEAERSRFIKDYPPLARSCLTRQIAQIMMRVR